MVRNPLKYTNRTHSIQFIVSRHSYQQYGYVTLYQPLEIPAIDKYKIHLKYIQIECEGVKTVHTESNLPKKLFIDRPIPSTSLAKHLEKRIQSYMSSYFLFF